MCSQCWMPDEICCCIMGSFSIAHQDYQRCEIVRHVGWAKGKTPVFSCKVPPKQGLWSSAFWDTELTNDQQGWHLWPEQGKYCWVPVFRQWCHDFQDGPQMSSRWVQQKPQACHLLDLKSRELSKFPADLAGNRYYNGLNEKCSPSP